MSSKYENVKDAREKLLVEINAALDKSGVWKADTCPTGEMFGWDMNKHYAMEWFTRNCPENWHIGRIYRHECYEWTITER